MDQAQTAQNPFAERIIPQFRDYQPFFVADYDIFNTAGTVDEDADLAAEIAGDFNEAGGQFEGAKFSNRYTPSVEALQRLDLT